MKSSGTKITKITKLPPPANKPSPILLLVILIAGGAYYYYSNRDAPNVTQTAVVTKSTDKTKIEATTKKLKYLMREIRGVKLEVNVKRAGLEKFFKKRGLNIAVDFLSLSDVYDDKKNGDWNFLLDSTFTGIYLLAEGVEVEPLIFAKNCSIDSHIIVPKASTYFADNIAQAKKIVFFKNGRISPAQLALALSLNLNPESLYYSAKISEILEGIHSGKIEGIIEDTYLKENGKQGDVSGEKFFVDYKQVSTTNYGVPCRVLYARKGTTDEEKESFVEVMKTMKKFFKSGTEEASTEKLSEIAKRFNLVRSAELEKSIKPYQAI